MNRASLVCVLAIACSGGKGEDPSVDAATSHGDGFPTGAISFFLGSTCPDGWEPFAEAVGRTIVPVASPGDAGLTVGSALAMNEVRAHSHDIGMSVDLPSVGYTGVAGGGNLGVSRSGLVDGTSVSTSTTAGLPYAQLLVCRKQADPGERAAPSGVLAFFSGPCPDTWQSAPAEIVGRFLVALPTGGTAGRAFGGAPLTTGERRVHTHAATGSVAVPSHGIALSAGTSATGYGAAGTHTVTMTASSGAVDMPYIHLTACMAP